MHNDQGDALLMRENGLFVGQIAVPCSKFHLQCTAPFVSACTAYVRQRRCVLRSCNRRWPSHQFPHAPNGPRACAPSRAVPRNKMSPQEKQCKTADEFAHHRTPHLNQRPRQPIIVLVLRCIQTTQHWSIVPATLTSSTRHNSDGRNMRVTFCLTLQFHKNVSHVTYRRMGTMMSPHSASRHANKRV